MCLKIVQFPLLREILYVSIDGMEIGSSLTDSVVPCNSPALSHALYYPSYVEKDCEEQFFLKFLLAMAATHAAVAVLSLT